MAHLAAQGIRVPGDVAVFGFDDLGFAATTDPPLSTVAQPVVDMAARAGAMLRSLIDGEDLGEEPVLFPIRLVLRESA